MERIRNWKLLTAGIAGLTAGSLYFLQLHSFRREMDMDQEKVAILSASRSIGLGETLTPDALAPREVPRSALPQRAVLPQDSAMVLGRTLLHPLPEGDPLLWTDIPEGPRLRFNTEGIPPGFRAVALPADEVRTLSRLLAPGDRVDIAWSRLKEGEHGVETSLLMERILVLGIGTQLERDDPLGISDSPSTITLLLRPEMGIALVKAMQTGEIFFLARNREDRSSLLKTETALAIRESGKKED